MLLLIQFSANLFPSCNSRLLFKFSKLLYLMQIVFAMDVTKTGNGEWGMGNGEWGMGNGEWGMGNGEWGMGNGKLKWEIEMEN